MIYACRYTCTHMYLCLTILCVFKSWQFFWHTECTCTTYLFVYVPQEWKHSSSKLNSKWRTISPTMPWWPKSSHSIGHRSAKKKIKHHCPMDPKYKKLSLLLPIPQTESLPPMTAESIPMQLNQLQLKTFMFWSKCTTCMKRWNCLSNSATAWNSKRKPQHNSECARKCVWVQ